MTSAPFIPSARPSSSMNALQAMQRMEQREADLKRKNHWRFAAGLLIIFTVLALVFRGVIWLVQHTPNSARESSDPPARPIDPKQAAWIVIAVISIITLFVAYCLRKESRSDAINTFLETGARQDGGNENPLATFMLMIAMLGLLYGEFLIIDAIKARWLRVRLRKADRHRAAVILGTLFGTPAGIDPRQLLRIGENPLDLRRTLAYLMAYEWADISPTADHLSLLSNAKRALRH